jgi:hypothetical protein
VGRFRWVGVGIRYVLCVVCFVEWGERYTGIQTYIIYTYTARSADK